MSSHTTKTLRVARYVAAFAVGALSFGAVQAGELVTATTPAQTTVNYADLDLSQDADVRSLYARLQRASERVCAQYRDTRNLRMKRLYDACYQDSLARAVDSIDHAAVTAVFVADERIRMAGRAAKAAAST